VFPAFAVFIVIVIQDKEHVIMSIVRMVWLQALDQVSPSALYVSQFLCAQASKIRAVLGGRKTGLIRWRIACH
jgi:hypothetical protein